MTRVVSPRLAVLALLSFAATVVRADDPCNAFAWDVTRERAFFGAEPHRLAAGQDVASAPDLTLDRLYQLSLTARVNVTFVVLPGKTQAEGSFAGLARLRVENSGSYRISLDQPVWLDVVLDGAPVGSRGFQGRPRCNAPHKIVEFVLPAGVALQLQFSGATQPIVRVTVTRSPAPAP